jgi:hypothetical protein
MMSRVIIPLLRINYLFLVPWIILSIPQAVIYGQSILLTASITILGVAGMALRSRTATSLASVSLLFAMIWAKIAGDLFRLPAPDTALLLLQFMLVILLMEASNTALTFVTSMRQTRRMSDEFSSTIGARVTRWARSQLIGLGKLTLGAFTLSLGLVVFGSIVSVSVNQLAFTGILVLASVIAILFLLTHKREPETR